MIRILDLVQVRDRDRPAWRFTLHLDGMIELLECFARRTRDGQAWAIYRPVRRDHGVSVRLARFAPTMRDQIAAALDAAIGREVAA